MTRIFSDFLYQINKTHATNFERDSFQHKARFILMKFDILVLCVLVSFTVGSGVLGSAISSMSSDKFVPAGKVSIPRLSFDYMLNPVNGYDNKHIGKTKNKYSISISHTPATITASDGSSIWGKDDCREQLAGFIPDSFQDSRILAVLDELEYVPCNTSSDVSTTREIFDITPDLIEAGDDLILNCRFKEHKTGRLFAGRRYVKNNSARSYVTSIISSRFRNQVHHDDLESQIKECDEVLNNIVKIDKILYDSNRSTDNISDNLVVENALGGSSFTQFKFSFPLEVYIAVYVLLLVCAVAAILGGFYYAYTRCCSPKSKSSQDSSMHDEEAADDETIPLKHHRKKHKV